MKIALAVAVCLFLAPVAGAVEYTFDREADFLSFRTYSLREGTVAYRLEAEKLIQDAVRRELEARGLESSEDSPDLLVYTYVLADRQTSEKLADPDYWEFITGGNSRTAWDFGAGTLVIDIVDAETGEVVWRAVSAGTVKGPFEKMRKRIEKSIAKMFLQYPPK